MNFYFSLNNLRGVVELLVDDRGPAVLSERFQCNFYVLLSADVSFPNRRSHPTIALLTSTPWSIKQEDSKW